MDIMSAFPRALFSEKELRAVKWFAECNGATGIPDIKAVKRMREAVLKAVGLDPKMHVGGLGDRYTTCDLKCIIADVGSLHLNTHVSS